MGALTILGTGNPIPDPNRAGAATLLTSGATHILIDSGRGVLMRLAQAGVMPIGLSAVLLTHLHSDHITDLNDVITSHWVMSAQPTTLRIFGPTGTKEVVDAILAMLRLDVAYRLAHHDDLSWEPNLELTEVTGGDSFEIEGIKVMVQNTDHRPVTPSVGFRFEIEEHAIALAGDTIPCDGLDRLCSRADFYVQTVVLDELIRQIPNARLQDILDYHSSVTQAAKTAQRNQVANLIMTHYVPGRIIGVDEPWMGAAREHFHGEVILADDCTRIDF